MGHTCVDNAEKLVLSPLLVEHDAVGNVDYLDYRLTFQRAILDLNIFVLILILLKWDDFENHVFDLITFYLQKVIKTKLFLVLTLDLAQLLILLLKSQFL